MHLFEGGIETVSSTVRIYMHVQIVKWRINQLFCMKKPTTEEKG